MSTSGLPSDLDPKAGSLSAEFSAPLGAARSGRLICTSGASNLTLRGDPDLGSLLYRGRFARHLPSVRVQEGVITVQYRTVPLVGWLGYARQEPVADISLNPALPWELEFRGGVSALDADLRGLRLVALDLSSTSAAQIYLPAPDAVAYIQLAGSASDLTFYRPAGVAVRFDLDHSASHLVLDGRRFGTVSGGMHWQSQDDPASPRYEIRITGSVSNLVIGRE